MLDGDQSTEPGQNRPDHELWLAMQAAHRHWINATGALDELAAASDDVPFPDESLRVAKASGQQCIAFQEYIEARLAFSEFLLSRPAGAGVIPGTGGDSAAGSWAVRTTSKFAILALVLALLCPAGFGLSYLVQARQHVRDLEAARDAMSGMLSQARSLIPIRPPDAMAPVASHPRPQKPTVPVAMPKPARHQFGRPGQRVQRSTYLFTITPSSRYTRVGPVRVSLHNLDPKHDCFDLSVMLGDLKFDKKHVRLHEPFWINLGGNSTSVRLLADRIGRNVVHGSLSVPEPKPARRDNSTGVDRHAEPLPRGSRATS